MDHSIAFPLEWKCHHVSKCVLREALQQLLQLCFLKDKDFCDIVLIMKEYGQVIHGLSVLVNIFSTIN